MQQSKVEALQELYLTPRENSIFVLQEEYPKYLWVHQDELNERICTLAIIKMIEIPPMWPHFWYISTVSRRNSNLGNMWTKIKYKSMKSCSQTNRRGNT